MRWSAAGLAALALLALGCETPLERGERLYREGDRLAALEVWREVSESDRRYARVRERVSVVEDEFETLVERYKVRGRYFEKKGRLAESILDYRLALKLQPDDAETLGRVQAIARSLAAQKARLATRYSEAMAADDLAGARAALEELRALDAFDPEIETDERYLQAAVRAQVNEQLEAAREALSGARYAEARDQLQAVLAVEPDNESARRYLAYIASVDREASAPVPAEAADPFASDARLRAESLHRKALADEQAQRYLGAIRQDLQALRADPQHRRSQLHLAELRRFLKGRGDVEALIEQGREAFQREDLQSALDHWRDALLIEPENERALAYAARAERQLANLESLRAEPDVASPGS